MNQPSERLYSLLPAIYRQRDGEQGEPLRALLAVMEQELEAIEADIAGLYEDWFIETCDRWVLPYIADLLGISSLGDEKHLLFSQRSYVANTIAYRRRKGIAAVIENVTFDVTGWRARAVEFFEQVGTTQHIQHSRPRKGATIDIRNRADLERLGSPFDRISRLVDVRQIGSKSFFRGKHSPLNLGLFVWRLQSYPINRSPAHQISEGCYTFHPLGQDMPLFNYPQRKPEFAQISDEVNLPIALGRQVFEADLNEWDQQSQNSHYYGRDRAFCIFKNGEPIPISHILSQDLSHWQRPKSGIAVDVNLGRFAFAAGEIPAPEVAFTVNYAYGFSADIGGGSYYRPRTNVEDTTAWQVTVGSNGTFPTLKAALAEWQTISQTAQKGIIRITDNSIYEVDQPITLPASSQLVIEAIDGVKPSLQANGDITIQHQGQPSFLTFDGLFLIFKSNDQGGLLRIPDQIMLTIRHCTVIGGLGAVAGQGLASSQVAIAHSIVGPIRLPAQMEKLTIQDSIVDAQLVNLSRRERAGGEGVAIAGSSPDQAGPTTTLERTTVFGTVNLTALTLASNVIFTEVVTVQRQQMGSIRFSYVPALSSTPQRYRCQPDLGLSALPDQRLEQQQLERQRLIPRFTSTHYGDPGYAQLSLQCALEITVGGDDGSEMGVFYQLHQPQRSAYLQLSLEEYVPAGLEAGIFYVT